MQQYPLIVNASRIRGWVGVAWLIGRALRHGRPRHATTLERVRAMPTSGLPLRAPVSIHWDQHLIPYVQAEHDEDLAVALGAVHAHLRLTQMEVMRRLARGRVAEVIGPLAVTLDHALRLMDFARAVPGIIAMLPPETRRWAEGFVAGVNHHLAHAPTLADEFALLGCVPEPWTLADLFAVARLASTDVSWLVFGRLLRARAGLDPGEWDALWPRMLAGDGMPQAQDLAQSALALFRGSNSAAVPAERSATGAAMIASDPHLSVTLPALWLVAGLHSPGYNAVGLMLPGIPLLGLGRNRSIAWGGTNLHAASSELVDVSAEPMSEREEVVRVRGGKPVPVRVRETRFGPVVSDGMLLRADRPLALRWVGHRPSDEMTALLGVMRARNFEEFRAALTGFAVPGQTMLVAEAGSPGRVGRVMAAHLPRRAAAPPASLVCAPDAAWGLDDLVIGADVSVTVGEAAIASANDRPDALDVPAGFFFSPPDRITRLRTLLAEPGRMSPADLQALQSDVLQPGCLQLRDALVARVPDPAPRERDALAALRDWDGSYAAVARGPVVFEVMVATLARRIIDRRILAALSAIWTTRALITQELAQAPSSALAEALRAGARALRRWPTWGDMHRLRLAHPLAAIPLLGRFYAVPRFAADGGNDTLNKTGHAMTTRRHDVTYGACARHISNLADPDDNRFVVLGGQDGWLGSDNAADQVALWRSGAYVSVPLRPETARKRPLHTVLQP